MDDNNVYVFSYDALQNEEFYAKLLGENVEHHKARLNGFAKYTDITKFNLLKKEQSSYVDGVVFKVTKDQLFAIDRWVIFPQYGRFLANVLLLDNNEILENVFVYSRLEISKPEKVDENIIQFNPNADEKNINAFIELENYKKNNPLYDFIFVYKIDKEQSEAIEELTHPFFALSFTLKKDENVKIILPVIITTLKNGDDYFAFSIIFGHKEFMNAIAFYDLFYDRLPDEKYNYEYTSLFMNIELPFLKNKPNYILSLIEDKKATKSEYGVFERAIEYPIKWFDINPWERFNLLLSLFFDIRKKKLIND